jgi:isocitrate dehydrogenase
MPSDLLEKAPPAAIQRALRGAVTEHSDHWPCCLVGVDEAGERRTVTHADIVALLANLEAGGLDFIKTENLCTFDGEPGFALGQGQ